MPYQSPGRHAQQERIFGDEKDAARDRKILTSAMTPPRIGNRDPAICPTDDDTLVPKRPAVAPSKLDKQSSEYVIKSGIAGGLAGCAAKTLVGPLDRVKILFQASSPQFAKYTGSWFGVVTAMKDIYRSNGTRGLFRGHSATLLRIFPYAGIKFLAYEQVRAVLIRSKAQETHVRRFLSGSIAGSLSVFATYPLEVVRVRLAFETKNTGRTGLVKICRDIYNEQPRGGILPSKVAVSSSQGVGTVGGASAAAASIATAASSAVKTVEKTLPRGGLANFYRGFTPTLWGMLPYAGSSFLTHDLVGDLLRHARFAQYTMIPHTGRGGNDGYKPAQLTSWAELIAGGTAGLVSQTVSYPLEVIRRRMQVGGAVGDGRKLRMGEVARSIWMEGGWRGFFVGLGIGYLKVVPMAATSFYVYERSKYWLGI